MAAKGFAAPLADTLTGRGTDPYAAAQRLIEQTIRKEYPA